MAVITWPSLTRQAPNRMRWSLVSNTMTSVSPLSGAVQTQELPGARWTVAVGYDALEPDDAAAMRAFLAKMRGQANRVDLWPFDRPSPMGAWSGTPLVKGAGQTGVSLATDGWTASSTLKAGDYLAVGTQLMMVVADATADGGGNMTITVEPPLRSAPADNAPLVLVQPKARFMLAAPSVQWIPSPSGRGSPLYDFELDFVEAWA